MIKAGAIFFLVFTGLAALAANIAYEFTNPISPGEWQLFPRYAFWIALAVLLAAVTLPAVLVMMIAGWRRFGWPMLVGLVAVVLVAGTWALLGYLEMALSPHEGKRAQQWTAVTVYFTGLAFLIPAYLAGYAILRRMEIMRPLLSRTDMRSSTNLP